MDLTLPRKIVPTEWSQANGLCGQDIATVPLAACLYKGMANWCLRFLASGKACYFIMVKSYQTSTVLYAMAKEWRETDLESRAKDWNRALPKATPVDTDDNKRAMLQAFGTHIAQQLLKNPDQDLLNRIKDLEIQVATKVLPRASSSLTMDLLGKFTGPSNIKKLDDKAPTSKVKKSLDEWIAKSITADAKKTIPSLTKDLKKLLEDVNEDKRLETLKINLVNQGMPMMFAATLDLDLCTKITVVTHLM